MHGSIARRVEIQGLPLHAITGEGLVRLIAERAANRQPTIIGHHNLHGLALARQHPDMARFYDRCDVVYADGMSVVWLARVEGQRISREHRVTLLDRLHEILSIATARRWRVGIVGGTWEQALQVRRRLLASYPGLDAAVHHGFLPPGSAEELEAVQWCAERNFDLLFMAMGMPHQERMIGRFAEDLRATVTIAVGGLFDYGLTTKTPPRWLGPLGLEWLFRLLSDPRRLAHRYLVEPWPVVLAVLRGWARRKLGGRR